MLKEEDCPRKIGIVMEGKIKSLCPDEVSRILKERCNKKECPLVLPAAELGAIATCDQSDGELKKWAQTELDKKKQSIYPAESIGKGCECIFPYEKHYVLLALDEMIEQNKEKLKDLEKAWDEGAYKKLEEAGRVNIEGLTHPYKFLLSDLNVVRERFKATPECKGG